MKIILTSFRFFLICLLFFVVEKTYCKDNYQKQHKIFYTDTVITIDGKLNDWHITDSVELIGNYLKNKTNVVYVNCLWNDDYLYIAYVVHDQQFNLFTLDYSGDYYLDDCVELYISTSPNKIVSDILTENEYQYVVNIRGDLYTSRGLPLQSGLVNKHENRDDSWKSNAFIAVTKQGTINNNTDSDTMYVVEMAIPWKNIQVKPINGMCLLADFCNNDLDSAYSQTLDWVGLSIYAKPQKWNELLLVKNDEKTYFQSNGLYFLLGILFLGISLFFFGIRRYVSRKDSTPLIPPNDLSRSVLQQNYYNQQMIEKLKEHIEKEYNNKIELETVASKLNISSRQLQRIIKAETGKTFTEIINDIRMQKADDLLIHTETPINQISLNVGIVSDDHFRNLFKAYKGLAPSEYRKSNRLK